METQEGSSKTVSPRPFRNRAQAEILLRAEQPAAARRCRWHPALPGGQAPGHCWHPGVPPAQKQRPGDFPGQTKPFALRASPLPPCTGGPGDSPRWGDQARAGASTLQRQAEGSHPGPGHLQGTGESSGGPPVLAGPWGGSGGSRSGAAFCSRSKCRPRRRGGGREKEGGTGRGGRKEEPALCGRLREAGPLSAPQLGARSELVQTSEPSRSGAARSRAWGSRSALLALPTM